MDSSIHSESISNVSLITKYVQNLKEAERLEVYLQVAFSICVINASAPGPNTAYILFAKLPA